MRTVPVVVAETDALKAVLSRMQAAESAVAFVEDEAGCFVGTFTRDHVSGSTSNNVAIKSLVRQETASVSPETILADLIPFVAATNAAVPVVDGDHKVVGSVDRISVMLALGGNVDAGYDPTANQNENGHASESTEPLSNQ